MRIEYDPSLVELAVFHRVRREPALEPALHTVIDPLYPQPAGADREARFAQAFAGAFQDLGLGTFIPGLLAEQPLIATHVALCRVREAPRARAESAELFQREGVETQPQRTVIIQLTPQHLADPPTCRDELRRELLHIADMLDPDFGYTASDLAGTSAQDNLVKDRYHVLWNITVEGRLLKARRLERDRRAALSQAFRRVFAGQGEPAPEVFDALWTAAGLTHAALLSMAKDPRQLPGREGLSGATASPQVSMGAPCALCGFSTFDWYDLHSAEGRRLVRLLTEDRRGWQADQAICRTCAEARLAREPRRPPAMCST